MVSQIPADSKWGQVAPPDQEGTGGAPATTVTESKMKSLTGFAGQTVPPKLTGTEDSSRTPRRHPCSPLPEESAAVR